MADAGAGGGRHRADLLDLGQVFFERLDHQTFDGFGIGAGEWRHHQAVAARELRVFLARHGQP